MPIYEYKCNACGHVFEEFQSVGASGKDLNCPSCGSPAPDKLFSAFASSGNGGTSFSTGSTSTGSSGCSSGFG